MRVQMHRRRFHERAIRVEPGTPRELAWHQRWPPDLHLTTALWHPGAQHPYRVSWEHDGLRFWASQGPEDRAGATVVVHGPALEAEFANPRHRFVDLTEELIRRGLQVKDAQFPFAAVCFASRWWVLGRRVVDRDDGKGRAVAVHQEGYRTLNYRLVAHAAADMTALVRGRGRVHEINPAAATTQWHARSHTDRHVIDMIVSASHARQRYCEGGD